MFHINIVELIEIYVLCYVLINFHTMNPFSEKL